MDEKVASSLIGQSEDVVICILSFLDPPNIIRFSLVSARLDFEHLCISVTSISVLQEDVAYLQPQECLDERLQVPCHCQGLSGCFQPSLVVSDAAAQI
jgi:hypothetical protein